MFRTVRIALDRALYDQVKRAAAEAGYASPEELITHAIEERLARLQGGDGEKELKDRLRGLGYLG
jgi:hypothetical protein